MRIASGAERGFQGARASRVLAKASRLRGLPCRVASEFAHEFSTDALGKFVSAGRRNQHARRARSPEFAIALLLLLAAFSAMLRADDFEAANQLYDQGKFGEAKQMYERLAGRGEWSANLFYNLGNAEYRIGAPGKAVLDYERALALDGTHSEARANLKWLRERTHARVPVRRWWEYAFPALRGDLFALVATVAAWGAIFGLLRRRNFGWITFALLLAAYAGFGVWRCEQERSLAIIIGKDAVARLAPADRASLAEPLPEGSRVRVVSERGEWIYCALPGGGLGWVAEGLVEKVRLTKL